MSRHNALVGLLVIALFGWVVSYVWPFLKLFSLSEAIFVVVMGGGLILLGWLPLVYPLFKSFRAVPRLPWRIRFILVVASITYGSAFLALATIGLPIELYVVYVAPQLQALGERIGEPVVLAAEFLLSYWWVGAPVLLSVASVLLTRYLLPRWPRVVVALSG